MAKLEVFFFSSDYLRVMSPFLCFIIICYSASDFFQEWWVEVTHEAKNGGSFFDMMGPSIY